MLFLVLQANYCEKISLMGIFSLVSPNAPGLQRHTCICRCRTLRSDGRVLQNGVKLNYPDLYIEFAFNAPPPLIRG